MEDADFKRVQKEACGRGWGVRMRIEVAWKAGSEAAGQGGRAGSCRAQHTKKCTSSKLIKPLN